MSEFCPAVLLVYLQVHMMNMPLVCSNVDTLGISKSQASHVLAVAVSLNIEDPPAARTNQAIMGGELSRGLDSHLELMIISQTRFIQVPEALTIWE